MNRYNVRRNEAGKAILQEDVVYDYEHQAWVRNGRYERCGHPESMDCRCYGRLHAGETANLLPEHEMYEAYRAKGDCE